MHVLITDGSKSSDLSHLLLTFRLHMHISYADMEMTKRKLFGCEADLKAKEEELAKNKNLAVVKSKYSMEHLVARKLAFKVCDFVKS